MTYRVELKLNEGMEGIQDFATEAEAFTFANWILVVGRIIKSLDWIYKGGNKWEMCEGSIELEIINI